MEHEEGQLPLRRTGPDCRMLPPTELDPRRRRRPEEEGAVDEEAGVDGEDGVALRELLSPLVEERSRRLLSRSSPNHVV